MADTIVQYILKMDDQTSEALEATGEAAEDAAKKTGDLTQQTERSSVSLKKLAAGALATVAAVGALSQRFADVRNELVDMSTRTGVATETLAGLKLAAEGSGLSFEGLARGLTRIPQLIADVERGAEKQVQAFAAIGMSVEDIRGASPEEVLQGITSGLSAIEDPARRAVAATDLLGSSGTKLLQALGDPGKLEEFSAFAREFGIDTGPKAAQAAADWQRAMADLRMVLEASSARLFELFSDEGLSGVVDDFSAGLQFMADVAIPYLGDRMKVLLGAFESFYIRITQGKAAFELHAEEQAKLFNGMISFDEAMASALDRMEQFQRGQKTLRSATEESDQGIRSFNSGLKDSEKQLASVAEALDPAAVALEEFTEMFGPLEESTATVDSLRASVADLFASMSDGLTELEALQVRQIDLDTALVRGSISAEEYAVAVDELNRQLSELQGADLEAWAAEMNSQIRDSLAEAIQDSSVGIGLDVAGSLAGGDIGGAITGALEGFLGPLGSLIGGALQTVAAFGERGATTILDDLTGFLENLFKGLPEIGKFVQELPFRLLKELPGLLQGLLESVFSGEGLAIMLEGIGYLLTELPGALISAIADGVWSGLQNFWSTITEWWESRGSEAREFIFAGEDDRRLFGNIWDSVSEGIQDLFSFDKGGRVSRTGLAVVHRGERIIQPGAAAGGGARAAMAPGGGALNVQINSIVTDRNAIPRLVRELERVYGDYGRTTSPLLGG